MMFTCDSFGSNCPENWQEIIDYLNARITDNIDKDDIERIWETYCNGSYSDAPATKF